MPLHRRSCIDHLGTAFAPAACSHFERNDLRRKLNHGHCDWVRWWRMVKVIYSISPTARIPHKLEYFMIHLAQPASLWRRATARWKSCHQDMSQDTFHQALRLLKSRFINSPNYHPLILFRVLRSKSLIYRLVIWHSYGKWPIKIDDLWWFTYSNCDFP